MFYQIMNDAEEVLHEFLWYLQTHESDTNEAFTQQAPLSIAKPKFQFCDEVIDASPLLDT